MRGRDGGKEIMRVKEERKRFRRSRKKDRGDERRQWRRVKEDTKGRKRGD